MGARGAGPEPEGAGEGGRERERHARLRALFAGARGRAPADRDAYLREACAGEAALQAEAAALLAEAESPRLAAEEVDELVAREAFDLVAGAGRDSSPGGESAEPGPPAFRPGSLLAGRYRIDRLLGRGGMGEVYEALDLELGIPVALKTIRSEAARTPEAVRRFKREVLLSRSVTHPRVCRIYDFGRHLEEASEVGFLTMELLRGESLAERVRARGRLPAETALPLVRQIAEALDAAHAAGIVHRDFKSANVMLVAGEGGERAVVTDFGLAWAAAGEKDESAAVPAGTPAYMSPEQVRGEPAGPAADLYALGVVLFEMVTGELPFRGDSPLAAACARLGDEPPSPRTLVADLDPRWEGTILRLLRREPKERFARAVEVVAALEGTTPGRTRYALPAERDAFVGREGELGDLERRLVSGSRLLTVLGPAGIGKTRLMRRLGWRLLERYPGGVWFCDLSEARSRDGVLSAVATALDVPLGAGDGVAQLGHAIAGRGRCLVLLDNLEQVVDHAEDTLGRWVERAPEAAFVATSRERLRLAGEEVFPLEPLPVESEGAELFAERARAQRPDFALTEANRRDVTEVVRRLEGLPLAIELAAARVRVLTPARILERLGDRFALLVGGRDRRHETLRAALDWSWELLAPWEKAALAQASVFAGGFTLEAAEAVLDLGTWRQAPGPAGPVVVDVVQALVDKSLLRTLGAAGMEEPRFGMYVTVREYAAGKLRAEGAIPGGFSGPQAERAAEERHGRLYARYGMEEALEALDRHGGVERIRALGRELDNLVAGCRRAVRRGDGEGAAATFCAVYQVLFLRGPFAAGIDLGREVLAMTALHSKERGRVLLGAGRAYQHGGRMEEAGAHFEQALVIHREVGNRRLEGKALGDLGTLYQRQGRLEEARAHLERELAIAREVGNRGDEGGVLANLGTLHTQQGRMEEARAHYERALAIDRELGHRRFEGVVLGVLGIFHQQQGRIEEARDHYESALAIHREVGDRRSEGIQLNNLGGLHELQGRLKEARDHFESALAILREVGERRWEGFVLCNLGDLHKDQGRMDEARALYERGLAIFCDVGDRRFEGALLGALAAIGLAEGDLAGAREPLARGEALLRDVRDPLELGKLLCVRADLERRAGDLAAARTTLAEAEQLAAGIGCGPASELGRKLAGARAALS